MTIITVKTGGIAADAVTDAKIADDVVGTEHLTANEVDTAALKADAVTGAQLADDAVNSEHYTDGSIDTAHIADANVTQGKIADQAINEAKLQISNAPTNGYMLTAQSGNTGGLTWAEAGGGKILQVIQDEYPTEQSSTSTSFVDIGGLSVSITPSSTSSKIFAMATLTSCRGIATNHTSCNVFYRLVRGSTELTHSRLNYYDNNANANREIDGAIALSYLDTPNSTSAQTYKCQMKALSGNTVKVNVADSSNSAMSTITVFEVGA